MKSGIVMRAAIVNVVYKRCLKLSPHGRNGLTSGEVNNLIAVDTQKLYEVAQDAHLFWALPLCIILVTISLLIVQGPTALVGVFALLISVPFMERLTAGMIYMRHKRVAASDERVQIINGMLQGMKVTKLNNYEKNYEDRIKNIRRIELDKLRSELSIWAISLVMTVLTPTLATACAFLTYAMGENHILTSAETFTVLLLFSALRFPINHFGRLIGKAAQALTSISRIADFLSRPIRQGEGGEAEKLGDTMNDTEDNEHQRTDVAIINTPANENIHITKSTSTHITTSEEGHVLKVINASFRVGGLRSGQYGNRTASEEPENDSKGQSGGFKISGFNFDLKRGDVLAVCGPVGSGKSTLIQGILGEVENSSASSTSQSKGSSSSVSIDGTISYVSQSPFILNATLRDNILFGLQYEKDKYEKVIHACCLKPDIQQLGMSADLTEIGERGVTLSGGQKQRVSLARAVYAESDLVLLDDPLSALDSGTSKKVFERLLMAKNTVSSPSSTTPPVPKKEKSSLLSNSAVVLVTHASHFLSLVDKVLVIVEGQAKFYGPWSELTTFKPNDCKTHTAIDHIRNSVQEGRTSISNTYDQSDLDVNNLHLSKAADGKQAFSRHGDYNDNKSENSNVKYQNEVVGRRKKSIMTEETREYGLSSLRTWKLWFKYAGGFNYCFVAVALLTLDKFSYVLIEYWLARWTEAADRPITELGIEFPSQTDGRSAQKKYLKVYFMLIGISTFAVFLRSEWVVSGGRQCTKKAFVNMLTRVLRAPMSYFETTPLGRIMNRFTYDTEVIDITLTQNMSILIIATSWYITSVIVMCTIIPWMALVIFPVTWLYWLQLLHYRRSGADLQRLDAVARSPIQTMVSEGLEGHSIIRTFRQENTFTEKFRHKTDMSSSALLNFVTAQRWLGVRIEFIGSFVVLAACALIVANASKLRAGIAALLIIWASNFTVILNFIIDSFAEAEAAITSIERVDEMSKLLQEKDFITKESSRAPDSWPEKGLLQLENVCMRYRKELPLALDNLCFEIKPGKRCGVVGRTGAGKSSLATALFRLVEIEKGQISLDGINLAHLGLSDVRGRPNGMSIIPQDPFLTGSTLRECLDPFRLSSNEDIISAIEAVRLNKSSSGIDVLETKLEEGGSNFSVGERQLLNLARALLQKPRVLVLDEATASIDGETDAFIQQMLRSKFQGTTLITVAHRLNTIMDYDLILVMDAGRAAEFGTPHELLQQNGAFTDLVNSTGTESARALKAMVLPP